MPLKVRCPLTMGGRAMGWRICAWAKGGTLRGIRLPGNRTVDLAWKDGRVIERKIY